MIRKARKFQVDRRTWYRGNDSINSRLLRSDGQRCCVGFYANACGIGDNYILHTGSMNEGPVLEKLTRGLKDAFVLAVGYDDVTSSAWAEYVYKVNDDAKMTDELREEKLKELFAEKGITIEFVN